MSAKSVLHQETTGTGSITNNRKNRQCPVTVGLSLRQTPPGAESSGDRKAGRYGKPAGKTSAARCRPWKTYRSVRLITKNEPVVSRNIFHRA